MKRVEKLRDKEQLSHLDEVKMPDGFTGRAVLEYASSDAFHIIHRDGQTRQVMWRSYDDKVTETYEVIPGDEVVLPALLEAWKDLYGIDLEAAL
jgi:hypothetical protein